MLSQFLYQKFNSSLDVNGPEFFKTRSPQYVEENLATGREMRAYQKEALGRLTFYLSEYQQKRLPVHLLFNMATGSGKTLVMAGAMLELYKRGYRNFIFFVNSTNIIEKTKNNFLNPQSSKYLFADKIALDGREVRVRSVDNFSTTDHNAMNVLFTTIQGLHMRMNEPRENVLTEEDFDGRDIVFLSDEAHHINALTRAGARVTGDEVIERQTWEGTITRVLNKNARNVMLEFTATIDLQNLDIAKKYEDKLVYRYDLAQFREDKYSKDIHVAGINFEAMDRALGAVVLSQYRRKVAAHNGLNLKPVVLLKSKSIKESQEFEAQFHETIRRLTVRDIKKFATQGGEVYQKAFAFFDTYGVTLSDLVQEVKDDFSEEKCISVNSKDDSVEKQILVNSLEDKTNQIRVVFAVDKLNEGWDVLNLFDIVRLYETRQSGGHAISPATMAEAQLIGRGARYWPFALPGGEDDRYTRKFDEDLADDMRILEELHYHTKNDSRYIAEIRNALVKTGALAAPENVREIDVRVKEDVKKTDFWKKGQVFVNEREQTGRRNIKGLKDVPGLPASFVFDLRKGGGSDVALFEQSGVQAVRELVSRDLALDAAVWREALYRSPFYRFDTLVKFFPHMVSIGEFITAKTYLGGVIVSVRGEQADIQNVTRVDELQAVFKALREIAELVENNTDEYTGTKTFVARPVHRLVKDKKLKITVPDGGDQEFGVAMSEARDENLRLDLASKDWYVYNENYGTREEKELVHFIHEAMEDLQKRYKDVRLLRNEKLFPLYRFSDGRRVEPDFVLFLREAGKKHSVVHQLFIEPKGPQLFALDAWKEKFLKEIAAQGKIENLFENDEYRVVGLPFYKHGDNEVFDEAFKPFI